MSHKQSTFRAGTEREQRQWHVWVCVCVGVCRCGCGCVCVWVRFICVWSLSIYADTEGESAPTGAAPVIRYGQTLPLRGPTTIQAQYLSIEEGSIQKKRQRLSLLFGGQKLFNSLPC